MSEIETPNKTAYMFAVIDTATLQVTQVLILSDRMPTMLNRYMAYGLLLTGHGNNYQQALRSILRQVNAPENYWHWVKPLLRSPYG